MILVSTGTIYQVTLDIIKVWQILSFTILIKVCQNSQEAVVLETYIVISLMEVLM